MILKSIKFYFGAIFIAILWLVHTQALCSEEVIAADGKSHTVTDIKRVINADNLSFKAGESIGVGVVDHGFNLKISDARANTPHPNILASDSPLDDHTHGNLVISAIMKIAPMANIYPYPNRLKSNYTIALLEAVTNPDIRIINLSFNFAMDCLPYIPNHIFFLALSRATKMGKIIVQCLGNEHENFIDEPQRKYYMHNIVEMARNPEMNGQVILVANSRYIKADKYIEALYWIEEELHFASNRPYSDCPYVITAPGSDILAFDAPPHTMRVVSGTSMSAPIVTGVFAALMSAFPGMASKLIIQAVMKSARKHSLENSIKPLGVEFGVGVIDYDSAYQYLVKTSRNAWSKSMIVARACQFNQSLNEGIWDISSIGITNIEMEDVMSELPSRMLVCDFSNNDICNNGAITLARHFNSHFIKDLIYLNLENNNIGNAGIKALGENLPRSLIALNLMNNNVSDQGIIDFVKFDNPSLKKLFLSGNNIGYEGKAALVKDGFEDELNIEKWIKPLTFVNFDTYASSIQVLRSVNTAAMFDQPLSLDMLPPTVLIKIISFLSNRDEVAFAHTSKAGAQAFSNALLTVARFVYTSELNDKKWQKLKRYGGLWIHIPKI